MRGCPDILQCLMNTHTEKRNNEVVECFGGLSYSAAAKIKQGFSCRSAKDQTLKKKVEKIERICPMSGANNTFF
jgi:hypothetical protein